MIKAFKDVIQQYHLEQKKLLLAVSGGVDSMVLLELCHQAGLEVIVAHCNYHLRGQDSDDDEALVAQECEEKNIPFFKRDFYLNLDNTDEKFNIQSQARKLRYSWFQSFIREKKADLILTAHHIDDAVETMLMNFFKGTGIAGLRSIMEFRDNILRPLIKIRRSEILVYAVQNQVQWRDDASNVDGKYYRNQVRNKIIPFLEENIVNVKEVFYASLVRFLDIEKMFNAQIEIQRKKLVTQKGNDFYLPVLKLKKLDIINSVLFEIIKDYGFNQHQVKDALHLLDAESGRYISSSTHRIIRNRNFLIITPLSDVESNVIVVDQSFISKSSHTTTLKHSTFIFSIKENVDIKTLPTDAANVWINLEEVQWPLIMRPWRAGDYFYPLGMSKKKKIARFLIDQKVPIHEKEKVWVIESNKRIVWIAGYRIDDRFKLKPNSKNVLAISLKPNT